MDLFQMDFFIYILILMMFVGAFFVIYGAFMKKESVDATQQGGQDEPELLSLAQKLDTLETSVYEADEAVHLLGDMSKNVFKEFDSKYQELLFLYNLVDEKQKTLAITGNEDPVIVRDMLYDGSITETDTPAIKRKTASVTRPADVPKIGPASIVKSSLDITVDDSTQTETPGINPRFAHVLQLSQEGKSVEEIARELDMGKGEIMLILNLGGRRQNA